MTKDKTLGINDEAYHTFFSETGNGKYVPRSVFIDLDMNSIDELRKGQFREQLGPE